MCGILGGTGKNWNYYGALMSMVHRGPDGQKITDVSRRLTMGFARLAIIDLSDNAMQPMVSFDGNVYITFNGEIYDYAELRKELINKGYKFKSTSDTEVLLNAYCEWGDEFINHVDGMFGIAIYDKRSDMLKLYRDRAGIKPLYWFFDGKEFAYASELKGIENLVLDNDFTIDNTALYDYYNYLYIPEPKTIYKNVFKLESAHRLAYDLANNKIIYNEKYWDLHVNCEEGSSAGPSEEQCYQVRTLIKKSIRSQLIADVSVGGFLSGGIDSSIIAVEAYANSSSYQTFAMGFYDFETNELPYVECLEKHAGFSAHKHLVKKEEFLSLYTNMKEWYDEPFADTSAYPTYLVSKATKKNCTVALSGDGGDEVFGGYSRYSWFSDYVRKGNEDIYEFLWRIHTYDPKFDRSELKSKLKISNDYDDYWFYRKYYIEELPPITRMQYLDFWTYLPCDVLTKTDRVGMAVSLETRVPLLAKDIIEYAFSLNQSERCYNGELKGILKTAYRGRIPDNLLYRRKWGFGIPQSFFGHDKNPQTELENRVFRYGQQI